MYKQLFVKGAINNFKWRERECPVQTDVSIFETVSKFVDDDEIPGLLKPQ